HSSTLCLVPLLSSADSPTSESDALSLHDALPISSAIRCGTIPKPASGSTVASPLRIACLAKSVAPSRPRTSPGTGRTRSAVAARSEEHTSELQSRENLVCRLLLEKKKTRRIHDRN